MKIFLTSFFLIVLASAYADNPISGNTIVLPGATETYTINWDNWGGVYENYANVSWTITGGTVLSSDKHTATIQWDQMPTWQNGLGSIEVYEDLGGGGGSLSIEILNYTEGVSANCDGVLGPHDIIIDFGHGTNPGPPLPNGATTYSYNSNCAIISGQYTRFNNSNNCRNQWHNVNEDHTPGDINGYFLLFDGDDRRGEIYRTTASGLVTGFKYEFSAWIGNLSKTIGELPKVRFEIYDNTGNTLLGSSGVISIPFSNPFTWGKVSFLFDLPVGITSAQIVLVNTNSDPIGNDFLVDDISLAPCYPPIIASFSNTTAIGKAYACLSGTVNLYSWWPPPNIVPFTNPSFNWQKSIDNGLTWVDIPGATSMNFIQTENSPGVYQYRIIAYETSNPSQTVKSNPLIYYVQKMVVEIQTFSSYSCSSSQQVQLNPIYYLQYSDPNGPTLNYIFNWSPSIYLNDSHIANPIASLPALAQPNNDPSLPTAPPVLYNYALTVTNTNFGCPAAVNTQTIAYYNPRKVFVPTGFTPNGDGRNDTFWPINVQDYIGAKFWVFNRWGQVIFYSEGPTLQNYKWDGNYQGIPQPPDVYVWRVELPGCPNNILSAGTNSPTGTITLIR